MFKHFRLTVFITLPALLVGCTVHPVGEKEERHLAHEEGKAFTAVEVSSLGEHPTEDDLVRRALQCNQSLLQKYWEWRSAIEQIPQDGTEPGNVSLFAGMDITKGAIRGSSSTLGIGNDPMADILLKPKLSTAAKRALENARAAGFRFRKAQFELRSKLLTAYAEYALTAELLRLEEENVQLIKTVSSAVEAKNRAGLGGQQDLLRTENELDLTQNELATFQSILPGERAGLNALLNRAPDAPIPVPENVASSKPLRNNEEALLKLAAERNPELLALAHETSAEKAAAKLASLQYIPDISLSANTDLAGITQSLMGMVTLPLFRYEAINAAVAQAEANIKAKEAMRRQSTNDIAATLVMDLYTVRDSERQLQLFTGTILPRAEQAVSITRSSYETGQASLLDFLDTQRSLIALKRMKRPI